MTFCTINGYTNLPRATFKEKHLLEEKFKIPDYVTIPLRYGSYPVPATTLEHYELIRKAVSNSEDWRELEILCSAYEIPLEIDDLGEEDEIFEVYQSEVASGRCRGRVVREEYERCVLSEPSRPITKLYADKEDRSYMRRIKQRNGYSNERVWVVCSLCGMTIGPKTKSRKSVEKDEIISKVCNSCAAVPRTKTKLYHQNREEKSQILPNKVSNKDSIAVKNPSKDFKKEFYNIPIKEDKCMMYSTVKTSPFVSNHQVSAPSSNQTNIIDLTLNSSGSEGEESVLSSLDEEPIQLVSDFKKELFASISAVSKEILFSSQPGKLPDGRAETTKSSSQCNNRSQSKIQDANVKLNRTLARKSVAGMKINSSCSLDSNLRPQGKIMPVAPRRPLSVTVNATQSKQYSKLPQARYSKLPVSHSENSKLHKNSSSKANDVIFEDDEIVRVEGPQRKKRRVVPLSEETRKARKVESERRLEQRLFKEFSSQQESEGFLINNMRPDEQEPELHVHSYIAVRDNAI